MTGAELLTDLQHQGFTLIPLPEGKLAVKPAEKLTDPLRETLRRYKGEILTALTQPQPSPAWPCPACGGPVRLDPQDENLPTRFWTCPACSTWGATREGAIYPGVWVSISKAVQ